MQINVTFRHTEPSEELREYVKEKYSRLMKYSDSPMNVHVVLSSEKFRNTAEVVVAGDGVRAAAKQEHDDLRAAIDLVLDKIERQLKKFREKIKNKRQSGAAAGAVQAAESAAEEAGEEPVITVKKINPKPMSIEEAADQLQISGSGFLAFLNADTNRVNVIYWRKDGSLGLLEP